MFDYHKEDRKAPKGKFRVIGNDHFPFPNEEWHEGDFDTLEEAKAHTSSEAQALTSFDIHDDRGKRLYTQEPVE